MKHSFLTLSNLVTTSLLFLSGEIIQRFGLMTSDHVSIAYIPKLRVTH